MQSRYNYKIFELKYNNNEDLLDILNHYGSNGYRVVLFLDKNTVLVEWECKVL
jgi:hypothetical protein